MPGALPCVGPNTAFAYSTQSEEGVDVSSSDTDAAPLGVQFSAATVENAAELEVTVQRRVPVPPPLPTKPGPQVYVKSVVVPARSGAGSEPVGPSIGVQGPAGTMAPLPEWHVKEEVAQQLPSGTPFTGGDSEYVLDVMLSCVALVPLGGPHWPMYCTLDTQNSAPLSPVAPEKPIHAVAEARKPAEAMSVMVALKVCVCAPRVMVHVKVPVPPADAGAAYRMLTPSLSPDTTV
jgi:hypothetical protein